MTTLDEQIQAALMDLTDPDDEPIEAGDPEVEAILQQAAESADEES